MLNSDLTITDYAQRRRVLGRRADMRLAQALRRTIPLHRKLRQQILRGLRARPRLIRPQLIRQWHNGSFVEKIVTLPSAA
ncbi:MAG TPA: hypothetical protein DIU07_07795 [Rhodobacteraceae bacterium]|nr:hypothetical protein [Paracoccaceae bacterium]